MYSTLMFRPTFVEVIEVAAKYPELYKITEGNPTTVEVSEKTPNLDYFNAIYSEANRSYIERLTRHYVDLVLNVK